MKVGLFYQSEQYDSLEHSGNYGKLAVKVPGHSGIMQMRFSVPILDMHGYWVPESRTPSTKIVWVIESKSAGSVPSRSSRSSIPDRSTVSPPV